MNILVVSNSVIIDKLLSLTFDKNSIDSEFVDKIDNSSSKDYNVIFIDDTIDNLDEIINHVKNNYDYSKLISISNNSDIMQKCDLSLKKPFMANDVENLLESIDFSDDLLFDDEDEEPEVQLPKRSGVLDLEEIDRIKALMTMQKSDSELLDENSYIDKLKDKENLCLKSKNSKKLFKELINLNKKELKKLLKGAKIRVRVEYE